MEIAPLTAESLCQLGKAVSAQANRLGLHAYLDDQAIRAQERLQKGIVQSRSPEHQDRAAMIEPDRPIMRSSRLGRLKAIKMQMEEAGSTAHTELVTNDEEIPLLQHEQSVGAPSNLSSSGYHFDLAKYKATARKRNRQKRKRMRLGLPPVMDRDLVSSPELDPMKVLPKKPKAAHLANVRERAIDRLVKTMEQMKTSNLGSEPVVLKPGRKSQLFRHRHHRGDKAGQRTELNFPNLSFLQRYALRMVNLSHAQDKEPHPHDDKTDTLLRLSHHPKDSTTITKDSIQPNGQAIEPLSEASFLLTQPFARLLRSGYRQEKDICIKFPDASLTADYARTCRERQVMPIPRLKPFAFSAFEGNMSEQTLFSQPGLRTQCGIDSESSLSISSLPTTDDDDILSCDYAFGYTGDKIKTTLERIFSPLPFWKPHRLG